MKQNNAIKSVLERFDASLSYDFEIRTMQRIQKVAERRERKVFILQMFLVSVVSAVLIFGVFYVINTKFEADLGYGKILSIVSRVRFYSFELYIAFLALVLLLVDANFRKNREAKNDNSMQVDKK